MQNWRKEIPAYLVIKEKCSLWNIRLKMLSSAMLYTQCVNNNGKSKIESKVRIFCHFFHHKQKCRCNHLIYNGILFYSVGVRRLELPTSTSRTWRASQLCYIPIFCECKVTTFFVRWEQNCKKLLLGRQINRKNRYICKTVCGNSSVGRALASQAEGRGFEPRLPLNILEMQNADFLSAFCI